MDIRKWVAFGCLFFLCLATGFGCVTPGTKATVTSGQGGPSIDEAQREAYNGPKARIAVSQFKDKTGKGWWTSRIGDGMADQLVTALYTRGRIRQAEDDFDAALKDFTAALSRNPLHVECLVAFSELLANAQRYVNAIQHLIRALGVVDDPMERADLHHRKAPGGAGHRFRRRQFREARAYRG